MIKKDIFHVSKSSNIYICLESASTLSTNKQSNLPYCSENNILNANSKFLMGILIGASERMDTAVDDAGLDGR